MDGNGTRRDPRSLTLRKHRREPASDPATARSARNRKSKITCGEHRHSGGGRLRQTSMDGGEGTSDRGSRTLSTVVSTTVDLVAGATALPLGPPTIPLPPPPPPPPPPCWDDTSPDGAEDAAEATATSRRRRRRRGGGGGSSREAAWTAAGARSTRSAIVLACLVLAVGLWACGAGAMLRPPWRAGTWTGVERDCESESERATIRRRRGGQRRRVAGRTYLVLGKKFVAAGLQTRPFASPHKNEDRPHLQVHQITFLLYY
jgi:hypothetical protein